MAATLGWRGICPLAMSKAGSVGGNSLGMDGTKIVPLQRIGRQVQATWRLLIGMSADGTDLLLTIDGL